MPTEEGTASGFGLQFRGVVVPAGGAQQGLPFELHVPNKKTMKAIWNSRAGKGKSFSTTR
jgi:hypothetical protein